MIRIGVSGHRFLAEIGRLQAGVDQALERIGLVYPGQDWTAVSSLAEGADRLVVERILHLRPAALLVVPLPLAVEDYLQDFSGEPARAEFQNLLARAAEVIPPPGVNPRSEGYCLAGKTMLEHSDVLVALWDGRPAQGRGGTGAVVRLARRMALPLAWVHCANRRPGTNQPASPGPGQGQVSFERL